MRFESGNAKAVDYGPKWRAMLRPPWLQTSSPLPASVPVVGSFPAAAIAALFVAWVPPPEGSNVSFPPLQWIRIDSIKHAPGAGGGVCSVPIFHAGRRWLASSMLHGRADRMQARGWQGSVTDTDPPLGRRGAGGLDGTGPSQGSHPM